MHIRWLLLLINSPSVVPTFFPRDLRIPRYLRATIILSFAHSFLFACFVPVVDSFSLNGFHFAVSFLSIIDEISLFEYRVFAFRIYIYFFLHISRFVDDFKFLLTRDTHTISLSSNTRSLSPHSSINSAFLFFPSYGEDLTASLLSYTRIVSAYHRNVPNLSPLPRTLIN